MLPNTPQNPVPRQTVIGKHGLYLWYSQRISEQETRPHSSTLGLCAWVIERLAQRKTTVSISMAFIENIKRIHSFPIDI